MMNIRSLTFQVVALVAIPAFAAYHKDTPYNFTFSSFARQGVITLPTEGEAGGEGYHLGEETETQEGSTTIQTPLFDRAIDVSRLIGDGDNQLEGTETVRPIAYIPQEITLTSIAIVTPGDLAPETLTLTVDGKAYPLTLDRTKTPETITLYGKDANGTVGTRSGVVHTYNVDEGETITLNPGTAHTTFSVAFQSNDAGGQAQNRTVYCVDGRPFLRIVGSAKMQHHIFKIDAAANPEHSNARSLAALLEAENFVDAPNTVIVVEFEGEGGGVSLDKEVLKSPIVFGSSVTPDKAHVHFPGTARLEGSITFRDGASEGGVSIYGPSDDAGYEVSHWNPHALLLRCDATLRTPLPQVEGNWFATHSTTIPAGRTFRLELDQPVDSEDNLPNLSFADATSRLELASDAASPKDNPLGIPSKYQTLLCTQSGTLVLDRNVSVENANEEGSSVLSGFVLSDSRVAYGIPVNRPLETHVILRAGHTYDFGFMFGFEDYGPEMGSAPIGKATLTVEGGTVEVSTLSLTATDATLDIQGGTVTAESLDGIDEGTNTAITVAEGATLALNAGLPAGADGTTATLDLTVKGTLNLGADLNMLPALRRELRLEGGAIAAAGATPVSVNCKDGTAAEADDFVIVSGGGTLKGSLTVDGISGTSSETSPLIIDTGATVKTLRDFAGTVSGAGRLEAIEGTLGDVTLGDTWLANATGKKLGDVLTGWTENGTRYPGASDFAGTIGFTAGKETAVKTLDFTDLDELTSLGMAFRINNHQHVIMRLDQYADAVIRWPDNPDGIILTLIESGAYGGELTLPHFPHTEGEEGSGVTFEFATFNPGGGYTVREDGYSHTHTEDGVNDTLTWDNPVFTGEGAWIDIEFNGDTRNTGWFTLGDYNGNPVTNEDQRNRYNGLLGGDNIRREDGEDIYEVLTQGKAVANWGNGYTVNFTDSKHPEQADGSLPLWYRPFVALGSLEYPEAWTVSLRLSAPDAAHTCILALGHNYTGTTAGIPQYEGNVYTLIFATGKTANEICLWVVPGVGEDTPKPDAPAFTVTLADATAAQHTFSVICDGKAMSLYVDGAWLGEQALPGEGARLTNGLQVGVQLGANSIPTALQAKDFAVAATEKAGGSIDFLRFYKGAMPEAAMVEIADRTPYVRENLRYVRTVPAATIPEGGETWIQDGAWVEQTYVDGAWVDGETVDQPAEGAECRILVAAGEHTLQVNVERQVEATAADGSVTNAGRYFYSPNRTYASLVVRAQDAATSAATLRLVPYGVTKPESGDTMNARPWETQLLESDWFKVPEPSTPGNRTGFRYGTLRFTGGANDPINDEGRIPNFYGAGYLLSGGATSASGEGTVIEEGKIVQDGGVQYGGGTYYYRYRQEVKVRYATTGAIPMVGIYDAGVCYLSRHANTVLAASADQIQTVEREWRQPLVYENGTYTANGERYIHRMTLLSTSDDTTVGAQLNTLEMVAGLSLTRGVMDEVARWQLTGPVVVQGTTEAGRDYVLGHAGLPKDQASEDVWVPFFGADSTWKFYDDTRVEGGDGNGNGAKSGLFARGVQTPGRLYLDFTATNGPATYKDTQVFSAQAWYRYGYEGNQGVVTEANMAPERASETDYDQAVAFQIRLDSEIDVVTLTLDELPTARVQTFHVEEEAGATKPLTLKLERAEGVEALKIWKSVVAAARLDVSNNNTGVATATSWEGNALSLRPEGNDSTRRTPVHRGNATHGHGAFIVGATEVDWDFGAASSVPRLEVIPGAELTFTVGQDFRRQDIGGITLVAQGKDERTFPVEGSDAGPTPSDLATAAWIHHRSAEPFLGQDVELGEGAIFGFHAEAASSNADVQNEGVVLAGELRLTGNATLRADFGSASDGAGAARLPHFVAAGGIRATEPGLTLIVDAPSHQIADGNENHVNWHSHTSKMTGEEDFRLWKTGPGTVTFYASEPPSVTGKVTVEEGILAVTTATDTPIGAKGLHVKAGATLADNGRMTGTSRRVARIPAGQILSGGGTVKGILRLESGAIYQAAEQGEVLTADGISVDGSLEANITIDLPKDYDAGKAYLKANREERNVRRRLLPMKRTAEGTERWDSIAWIDSADASTSTTYAARRPQVPAPTDYEGYGEGSPPTITGIIETPLINQYQNAGHAYIGATHGRTRAGTYALNPDELSDALLCFTNISAFVDASAIREGREYVDGTNFYVGYEFGISRQALVTIGDTKYVVLEVSVESVFNDEDNPFEGVTFSPAQKAFVADFNSSAILSFDLIDANGEAHPLGKDGLDIPVEEVTDMDGTPVAEPGKRCFRIPYQDLLKQTKDGNIRLRASATSPYAERLSTR